MTPHQILIVAIRLLAVFWLFGVLSQIAAAIATLQAMGTGTLPIWVLAGVQLVICLFLWLFPATLASKLLRGGDSPVSAASAPFAEWRDLLFVTVGIFVLARSIPNALYWAVLAAASEPLAPDFTLEQKVNTFSAFLELFIGIGLVLGASALGSLIQNLRTASTR